MRDWLDILVDRLDSVRYNVHIDNKEREMSNISKAQKLQEAIDKLHEADALMQEALGASEECFDLHCAIESVADDIAEYAEQLVEMQVTD